MACSVASRLPLECRQHLLLMFEAFVAPSTLSSTAAKTSAVAVGSSEGATRAARANCVALLEARGVQLMVDILAGELAVCLGVVLAYT